MKALFIAGVAISATLSCTEGGIGPFESENESGLGNYVVPNEDNRGISSFRGLGGKGFGGVFDDYWLVPTDDDGEPLEFSPISTNPYFPMNVGDQWRYGGVLNGVPATLLKTVLDETRIISVETVVHEEVITLSFETRVVDERLIGPGQELVSFAWNYYAEAADGDLWLFGSDLYSFPNPEILPDSCGSPHGVFVPPLTAQMGDTYFSISAFPDTYTSYQVIGTGPIRVPFGRITEALRVKTYGLTTKEYKDGEPKFFGRYEFQVERLFPEEIEERVYALGVGELFRAGLPLVDFVRNAPAPALPPLPGGPSCALEE